MPGAKGDKGDEGAIGPQGLQGATGLQGPAGADAAWYYNGEYNPGAGYSVGDVVTYEGQTWYRKNANGGNVGDTPSEGLFWDLIAAKGADGGLTYWDGTGNPGTPTNPGIAILNGIATPLGGGLLLSASDKITINANNGEFINDATVPANQIATIGDLTTPTSGTWDTKFAFHSGIDVSVTNEAYESNKMGYYYCVGDLVHWEFRMILQNPVSWGTRSSWNFELPFPPYHLNEYGPTNPTNLAIRNAFTRTVANGWMTIRADQDPTPQEGALSEGNSYEENEYHSIFVNAIVRAYIQDPLTGEFTTFIPGQQALVPWPAETPVVGIATIFAANQEPEIGLVAGYPGNPSTIGYKAINSSWPAPLAQALADQNDGTPANNASINVPDGFNVNSIQLNFSGVYRRA